MMTNRDKLAMPTPIVFRQVVRKVVIYMVLIAVAIAMVFPLYWMVSTSLKPHEEAMASMPTWWPRQAQLDAYAEVLGDPKFVRSFLNSGFVTTLAVAGTLISVSAAAYAFSRVEWPGRNLVFYLMLSTLMLPLQTTLVPQYVMFNKLGWIGTFIPITIPGFFAGGALYIFLLRQFMMTLPRELDEAAIIDGASHVRIWWEIILPLTKPALATVAVFLFVAHWNSLQTPLIYLQNQDMHTLPIFIAQMRAEQMVEQPWERIMAASVVALLPLLAVFLVAQRYVLESVALTGTRR